MRRSPKIKLLILWLIIMLACVCYIYSAYVNSQNYQEINAFVFGVAVAICCHSIVKGYECLFDVSKKESKIIKWIGSAVGGVFIIIFYFCFKMK